MGLADLGKTQIAVANCAEFDIFKGYRKSLSLEVDFVLETVKQLMEKHGNELKTDVLIHSDQGCHYTSNKFIDILGNFKLRQMPEDWGALHPW